MQVGSDFPALLRSHLLPSGPASPLETNDFEGFLQWREEAIWSRIQEVTGVRIASDLFIDEPEEFSA
jgi:hypothetical protein